MRRSGRLPRRGTGVLCASVLAIQLAGCSATGPGTQATAPLASSGRPARFSFGLAPTVIRVTGAEPELTTRVESYIPGQASQQETPTFPGRFFPETGLGSASIRVPEHGIIYQEPLVTFGAGSTWVAQVSPFASGGSAPRFDLVPYARLGAAAAVGPMRTEIAVLLNPANWLAMLRGAASVSPVRLRRHGTTSVDLVVDLERAAAATGGSNGAALKWLASYWRQSSVSAQVSLTADGRLDRMLLVHPPPAASAGSASAHTYSVPADAEAWTIELHPATTEQPVVAPPPGDVVDLSALAAGSHCQAAGSTGLTAAVVARAAQKVTGNISAQGCDIGVYVGPGANGASIAGATISGALDHAVLVEGASHVSVTDNTLSSSAGANLLGHFLLPEDKVVSLVGTTWSRVAGNTISGSLDGGISVTDDGLEDPSAPNPGPRLAATHDAVAGNLLRKGSGGCAIITASYNDRAGVRFDAIRGNVVDKVEPGGIVVAATAPGGDVAHVTVEDNTVTGSSLPGVIVHANAPGDELTGTIIRGNRLSHDGSMSVVGLRETAGIALIGNLTPIDQTVITGNVVQDVVVGVWQARATATTMTGNDLKGIARAKAVVSVAAPTRLLATAPFQ